MKKTDVIEHFKSASAAARVLDISRQSFGEWGEVIPEGAAYKLQVITGGVLKVDPSVYARAKKRRKQAA